MMLATMPQATLDAAARDETFLAELRRIHAAFRAYRDGEGWFQEAYPGITDLRIAYLSLELRPVEDKRRLGVCIQFARLPAVVVCVEDQTFMGFRKNPLLGW